MDIKEIILIVGGLLIVAIIGHGLWVKHSRRNRLRMDISPKSFSEADAESTEEEPSVRGELPNGGARIVSVEEVPPRQDSLQLEVDPQRTSRETQHRQNLERQAKAKAIRSGQRKPPLNLDKGSKSAEPGNKTNSMQADGLSVASGKLTELIVVNVLAASNQAFAGADLVAALRRQGLRFGEMSIFHRIDEASSSSLYSVANAVEPGTFDLADLAALKSPGLSFFLQLPTAVDGIEALESMLSAAQNVAQELGGELKDENMSAMTGQTSEHLRQRVSDFARRYLTQQAAETD
ncbi:MAG: cell division protein ZipA [Pseudomonadota bacterium]|nr:cell division protein ZipA [Pseudomonadota bacterium]